MMRKAPTAEAVPGGRDRPHRLAQRRAIFTDASTSKGNSETQVTSCRDPKPGRLSIKDKVEERPEVKTGGASRNRTGVHGFAGRCVTTPPSRLGRRIFRWRVYSPMRMSGQECRQPTMPSIALPVITLYNDLCRDQLAGDRSRAMDFTLARCNMVECQLRTNKVTSPALLEALRAIPRERFVPTGRRSQAYLDEHVPIAEDRWLMPPMPMARLIQESYPTAGDNAMVIGAGMGYSAAVMGRLCKSVFAVENDKALVEEMSAALTELALDNVVAIEAPLTAGYPDEGPYDVILLAGGVGDVPPALFAQLAEGGRLMAILGASPGAVGHAVIHGKRNGVVSNRTVFDARVKPLPGFGRAPAFVF